ncbi:MAG: DEDD exonuclease domain-containing protein [Kineosporiaceae bacterium]|nr:DEDD exonuclease domain-containing protein [Kineosporiaceae bacterium]
MTTIDTHAGLPTWRPGAQISLDELGTPLHETTFVVVDLETTGGSAAEHAITEIGAVKVRGGQVLGEFQTLVNPGEPIPAFISVLTGITNPMVATAPRLGAALAAFLEFLIGADAVVAHNAGFDTTFLKTACAATGRVWPALTVIDTVGLARAVVRGDEARNHKLSTLARLFRSRVEPNHRALTDARATVDVLHALVERLGPLGVASLEELATVSTRVPEKTRRKRHLADDLPNAPGVYVFRDGRGRPLYVGTSVDVRTRVRTYFTATEKRTRMSEMVALAESVTAVVCATALEARVRELRLIAEHAPPYNRRSRFPQRAPWIKLTAEAFPRLSVVRTVIPDGATYVGPFSSHQQAELAVAGLHEAIPLRQCTSRLPRRPSPSARACILAEIGRCGAPCIGGQDVEAYRAVSDQAAQVLTRDATAVVTHLLDRATDLASQERFEEAARHRDRLLAVVRAVSRTQRLAPLAATRELLAARQVPAERAAGPSMRGWELILVRYGRLAATTTSPPGADPRPYLDALRATGEQVPTPPPAPLPAAHPEETEQVLRWLEQPGVRLVDLDGEWSCPQAGAGRHLAELNALGSGTPS